MSTEYAGITIIVDEGTTRRVINIPAADVLGMDAEWPADYYRVGHAAPDPSLADLLLPPRRDLPILTFRFGLRGEYTIREETVPMRATPATELSEHEQAEVDRFGIHDEDRRVW